MDFEDGSAPPSSSSCCLSSRGTASGVPFTESTDSLCRACLRGYVGVFGGRTGLKTVEAGLNWEVVVDCLTGEMGREEALDGDISPLAVFDIMCLGCNPVSGRPGFEDGIAAFPIGLEKRGRLGVAFVGKAGARRAVGNLVRFPWMIMPRATSDVRVFEARSSS
jgi:hypothetical protein